MVNIKKSDLECTKVDFICLEPKAGAVIGDCLLEGITMASALYVTVVVKHNGKTYKISPGDILDYVDKQNK